MSKEARYIVEQLIIENKTQKALLVLLKLARESDNKQLLHNVNLQIAILKQIEKDDSQGTITREEFGARMSKLRGTILSLVQNLDGLELPNVDETELNNGLSGRNLVLLSMGIFFGLLAFFSILFLPCPNELQYSTFRIILSISVAGIAGVIMNLFNFKFKNLFSISGALVILVIANLSIPILANRFSSCNSINLSLILKPNSRDLKYDPLDVGAVRLYLGTDMVESEINKKGIADFKNIPTNFKDIEILAELRLRNWQFAKTKSNRIKFHLKKEHLDLEIEPDNSLATIFGQIRDEQDNFVAGATVNVKSGKVIGITDNLGRFDLTIPLEYQDEKQQLSVYKEGFKTWDNFVYPGLKNGLNILLKSK